MDTKELKIIIEKACKYKFLNGWFGDVSQEFQEEQYRNVLVSDDKTRMKWVADMSSRVQHHETMKDSEKEIDVE